MNEKKMMPNMTVDKTSILKDGAKISEVAMNLKRGRKSLKLLHLAKL